METATIQDPVDPDDVQCPLCEYNLRGLTEPRCPECGAPFDWDELRDPARRKHPYLFEHHPERNLASFIRTLVGGLFPRRFWKTLSPVQPSRPGRLLVYWIICVILAWMGFYVEFAANYRQLYVTFRDQRAMLMSYYFGPGIPPGTPMNRSGAPMRASPMEIAKITRQLGSVQRLIDQTYPRPFSMLTLKMALGMKDPRVWSTMPSARPQDPIINATVYGATVLASWPWCAVLVMMIFRASMRRSRVRPIHLLRVVIYSSDFAVWLGIGWAIVVIALAWPVFVARTQSGMGRAFAVRWLEPLCFLVPILAFAGLTYRLGIAMRRYLRFRHAMWMAISVNVIVVLAGLVVLVYLGQSYRWWW